MRRLRLQFNFRWLCKQTRRESSEEMKDIPLLSRICQLRNLFQSLPMLFGCAFGVGEKSSETRLSSVFPIHSIATIDCLITRLEVPGSNSNCQISVSSRMDWEVIVVKKCVNVPLNTLLSAFLERRLSKLLNIHPPFSINFQALSDVNLTTCVRLSAAYVET